MRERSGKTKAINISEIDGNTLHKAIHDNVSHGSTIYINEFQGYRGIGGTSYKREQVLSQWQGTYKRHRERVGGYEARL